MRAAVSIWSVIVASRASIHGSRVFLRRLSWRSMRFASGVLIWATLVGELADVGELVRVGRPELPALFRKVDRHSEVVGDLLGRSPDGGDGEGTRLLPAPSCPD